MSRGLDSAIEAVVGNENSEFIHLIELAFQGGTVRYSTGTVTLDWNGHTWTAIGGALGFDAVSETSDDRGQGVELQVTGADVSVIATILSEEYIGRDINIWRAWLQDGAILDAPVLIFKGVMNAGFEIEEQVDATGRTAPSCTIRARMVSRLAIFSQQRGFRTNLQSHQAIYPGDTFFQNVHLLPLFPTYWGQWPPKDTPWRTE